MATASALRLGVEGSRNDAAQQQREHMGMVMVQKSIDLPFDDSRRVTTVVGNYFTETELKEEFAALVGGYTALQLANASGCGVDAAKKWLTKKSLPNTASTFNMAQRLPVVREWALKKIGMGGEAQMNALRKIVAAEVSAQIEKRPAAPSVGVVSQTDKRRA